MQYALWQLSDDKRILVDANEMWLMNKYFESDDKVQPDVIIPEDDAFSTKVVYGVFMHNPDFEEDVENYLCELKGYGLAAFVENKCTILGLEDIQTYKNTLNERDIVPFAALITTTLEIPTIKQFGITAFKRYGNIGSLDNILNREGLFSIKSEERRFLRKKDFQLTQDNWKEVVDESRALAMAGKRV